MEIEFHHFDYSRELTLQRELFRECFPETIGLSLETVDHYLWKFHSKGGASKSMEYSAYLNNKLVGYYAAIPLSYKFLDKSLKVALVCDVMTGVNARGKGVFTKLGFYSTKEIENEGFDFTTGYPIRPEVLPGHLKVGWEVNLDLPLYVCFVSFKSLFEKIKIGFLSRVFDKINSILYRFNFLFHSKNSDIQICLHSSNDVEILKKISFFYLEWQKEVPIALTKDFDFLSWRLGAPNKEYTIITLNHNNNIVGVLISTAVEKEGVPCMGIIDFSIFDGYYDFSRNMLEALYSKCIKNGLELILVMLSKYWAKKYKIQKSLFFASPYKFNLIIKNFTMSNYKKDFQSSDNWHVMWIDSDNL
jgi:hypothetical protein